MSPETHPDLFTVLDDPPHIERPLTLAERFQAFDEANPHVTELLVRLARDWKRDTGRDRLGIAMLWERLRWELSVRTTETPVLNNDYKAFFARKLMTEYPDLVGLFETRRSAADDSLGRAA